MTSWGNTLTTWFKADIADGKFFRCRSPVFKNCQKSLQGLPMLSMFATTRTSEDNFKRMKVVIIETDGLVSAKGLRLDSPQQARHVLIGSLRGPSHGRTFQ